MQSQITAMLYNLNNTGARSHMVDLNQDDMDLLYRLASLRHCTVYLPPNGKNVKYPFFIKKELNEEALCDSYVLCEDLSFYGFSFLPDSEDRYIEIVGRTR